MGRYGAQVIVRDRDFTPLTTIDNPRRITQLDARPTLLPATVDDVQIAVLLPSTPPPADCLYS